MMTKRISLSAVLAARRIGILALVIVMVLLSPGCKVKESPRTLTTKGEAGYFKTQQQRGVWWFTDPADETFISIGINHIEPVLITSENNREKFIEKYGKDLVGRGGRPNNKGRAARLWAKDSMNLVRQWGFNTLGVHNPVPQDEMPYVAKFRPISLDGWADKKRRYPDPFDPKTEARVNNDAHRWCLENADDSLILGVSFNDMPIWRTQPGQIHEWVKAIMALPPRTPGKIRWVEFLKTWYADAKNAEAIYGIGATTWDDFLARQNWETFNKPEKVEKDCLVFLPIVADAWYSMETRALKLCDPNHLVFGDKFEGAFDLPEWLDPVIKKYFDVIYIQWYGFAEDQLPRLRRLHQNTGKPILLGDSSFSCPNENIPHPKGVHLPSQEQVGKAYYEYLETMMKEPYILGWHYCGFIEGSPDLKKTHLYFSIQSGLLKPDGTPYEKTVAQVTEANSLAQKWHAEALSAGQDTSEASSVPTKVEQQNSSEKEGETTTEVPNPLQFTKFNGNRCKLISDKDAVISQVDENVFNAGRFVSIKTPAPKKNISWVITDEGVVVIDAGSPRSAKITKKAIRSTTQKPIKYLIYTHHHGTQIEGAKWLMDPDTKIIAQEDLVLEFDLKQSLYKYHSRLNATQFNFKTGPPNPPSNLVYPDITYRSEYKFTLGNTRFELFHADAEAQDYSVVYLPDQKIVWVADLVSGGLPMIASPMKPVRDEMKWIRTLKRIRDLDPEVMIDSIFPPICDQTVIGKRLDIQIRYMEFIHEYVLKNINEGVSVERAVAGVTLPDELTNSLWLKQKYGANQFNIRGLYHKYTGWFDQNGTHLDPAPSKEVAESFIAEMGGGESVLAKAQKLMDQQNPKLALEYLDTLIAANDHAIHAHHLKSAALLLLAGQSDQPITKNMYRKLASLEAEKGK